MALGPRLSHRSWSGWIASLTLRTAPPHEGSQLQIQGTDITLSTALVVDFKLNDLFGPRLVVRVTLELVEVPIRNEYQEAGSVLQPRGLLTFEEKVRIRA